MTERLWRLASPVFLAAVALLALNDHVLKERFPGLVTGKLSDIAGVFAVAILVTVFTGHRTTAVVATAVLFTALKTVPAVATGAAPLLGGPTLVDPTDLVALLVLVPAWYWLGRAIPEPHQLLRQAAGVGGGCFAALALTATSCVSPNQVMTLERLDDGTLLAATGSRTGRGTEWATSRDGRVWTAVGRLEGRRDPTWRNAPPQPQIACLEGGSCFRVGNGKVETQEPGGAWHTAFAFTDKQAHVLDRRTGGCGDEPEPFDSVVIAGSAPDEHVVVGMGSDGVLWRDAEGHWQRRAVLGVEPDSLDASFVDDLTYRVPLPLLVAGAAAIGLLVIAGVAALAFLLARRHRSWPVAGWYVDPEWSGHLRWWDGHAWTGWRHPWPG